MYIFLIWEKICTTSPTALMVLIRSMSLVIPPMLFCWEPFHHGEGKWTSNLASNLSTIFGAFLDVAAAPETLGMVGNLCSPARRPEHRSVYSHRKEPTHTPFWSVNKYKPLFRLVCCTPFDDIDGVQLFSCLSVFNIHWIDRHEPCAVLPCIVPVKSFIIVLQLSV